MSSITWGLQINNEGIQNVSDMSILAMSLNMTNLEKDDLSITLDYINGKDLIKFGDKVKLYLNDAVYFQGVAASPKNSFTPDEETIDITVEGLWTQLSKKQDINSSSYDESLYKVQDVNVRDYRNYTVDDNQLRQIYTTKSLLLQVLEDAQTNGVQFDIGGILLEDYAGYSFVLSNPNILEMINAILAIHPDYTAYVDYSTENPTLHVVNKKDIPTVTFPLQGPDTTSFDITNRNDLIPRCIKIHSLALFAELESIPNITNKRPMTADVWAITQTFVIDENSTVECKHITLLPKEVTGSKSVTDNSATSIGQSQRIKTLRYPQKFNDNAGEHSTKKWWSHQIQFLYELQRKDNRFNVDDLVVAEFDKELKLGYGKITHITGHKAELIDDLATDPDSRFKDKKASDMRADDAADIPNQLLAGSVEDWMENSAKVGNVKVTASVGVKSSYIAAIGDKRIKQQFLDTFPIVAKINGVSYNFNTFSRQFQATNLNTGTYYAPSLPKQVENSDTSNVNYTQYIGQSRFLRESAYLYVNYLMTLKPWEGSLTITNTDIYVNNPCGRGLNVIGGDIEWETMKVPITDVAYDIANGITQMSFGVKYNEFDQSLTRNDPPSPSWNNNPYTEFQEDLNYITGSFATPEASSENLAPKAPVTGPACLSINNVAWEGQICKCYFNTGNIWETNPRVGMKKHDIVLEGFVLDSDSDSNYLELSPNKTYDLWLVYNTNQWGEVVGSITITLGEPLEGQYQHYIVPSPESTTSRTGKFKSLVYSIQMKPSVGDDPTLLPRSPLPTLQSYSWEGINKGGLAKVYKKYNENEYKHQFRTIGPIDELPTVETIPIQIKVSQRDETINIEGCIRKESIPTYEPSGANVDLQIFQTTFSTDGSGHLVATRASMPEQTMQWRKGILVGVDMVGLDPADTVLTCDRNSV
jgi:hypothetical protein